MKNHSKMPEKHRKSGTFHREVPLRYYKYTKFHARKQIMLKSPLPEKPAFFSCRHLGLQPINHSIPHKENTKSTGFRYFIALILFMVAMFY